MKHPPTASIGVCFVISGRGPLARGGAGDVDVGGDRRGLDFGRQVDLADDRLLEPLLDDVADLDGREVERREAGVGADDLLGRFAAQRVPRPRQERRGTAVPGVAVLGLAFGVRAVAEDVPLHVGGVGPPLDPLALRIDVARPHLVAERIRPPAFGAHLGGEELAGVLPQALGRGELSRDGRGVGLHRPVRPVGARDVDPLGRIVVDGLLRRVGGDGGEGEGENHDGPPGFQCAVWSKTAADYTTPKWVPRQEVQEYFRPFKRRHVFVVGVWDYLSPPGRFYLMDYLWT